MSIKYLKNNSKKNNQIKNYEIKFVNSEKFVVKMITNKLYIGSSDKPRPFQTPHIIYHTSHKISDK